jgi:hypothetical protein
VLDPATAVVLPGGQAPLPTLYVAEDLLVRGKAGINDLDPALLKAVAELGWQLEPADKEQRERPADDRLVSRPPLRVRLVVRSDRPSAPVDAWVALQQIAAVAGPDIAADVELNHVLLPSGGGYWSGIGGGYWSGIGGGYWSGIGGGYWSGIGGGYWSGIGGGMGPAEYGVPGFGGKAPVSVVMADPAARARRLPRPPVVVLPDTGIGPHPWFPREFTTNVLAPGTQAAPQGAVTVVGSTNPDDSSSVGEPLTGGASRLAGHGTFIAGIVRQTCPEARLESHPVMSSDGVIIESDLIGLLHDLLARQVQAVHTQDAANAIDVISLSAGYYHEASGPTPTETSIADVLADLGRMGVLVVAGAGNDATDRPFLPAGLSITPPKGGLPLVSVGSLNPNRVTVALFSNSGAWVKTYRSGAAIVSTLPTSGNAGAQASAEVANGVADNRPRATIDGDDFSGGFGVWSGTSFATPVLAGELARALADDAPEKVDLDAMIARGNRALARVLGPRRLR